MMVAAVEHGTGLVLGQVQVGDKTNEIPAVRELTRDLDLRGRVVTLDALHAQHETARVLVKDCGADYVVAAVKGNQPTMLDDLQAIDWRGARHADSGWEKAHGRLERRRCAVLDLGGPQWGRLRRPSRPAPGVSHRARASPRQAGRGAAGKPPTGSPRSAPRQAGPEELAALVRCHWHIENRLHYVRDFTYDEGPLPGVRGSSAAQSRLPDQRGHLHRASRRGRFEYLPPANRHYAARPQEALDAVMNPPSR